MYTDVLLVFVFMVVVSLVFFCYFQLRCSSGWCNDCIGVNISVNGMCRFFFFYRNFFCPSIFFLVWLTRCIAKYRCIIYTTAATIQLTLQFGVYFFHLVVTIHILLIDISVDSTLNILPIQLIRLFWLNNGWCELFLLYAKLFSCSFTNSVWIHTHNTIGNETSWTIIGCRKKILNWDENAAGWKKNLKKIEPKKTS